tara:strand:+ start:742 stop:2004 length:1263 start_codon:yes stop_codon:yes gene_type:complete
MQIISEFKSSEKIIFYIYIITPVVIFVSKFLSDLCLSIIAIYTLFKIFKIGIKKIEPVFFFFIFILYIVINLFFNNFSIIYLLKAISLIRFPLFILFPFIYDFNKSKIKFEKIFLIIYFIPILVFLMNMYTQSFLNTDIFGIEFKNDYQRISSFFYDEYIAGTYLFFVFYIFLNYFNKIDFLKLIFLSTLYFAVFLSGDRTPFIVINFFIFIIFFLNIKSIFKSKYTYYFIIILFSFFMFLTIFKVETPALSKYLKTVENVKKDFQNSEGDEFPLKRWGYYGLYVKSYITFKKSPIIGHGYKSFRIECKDKIYDAEYNKITNNLEDDGCDSHPHNIYLEVLSDLGLIGFLLFFLLLYNFYKLKEYIADKIKAEYFLVFLVAYFFPFKPFGSLYSNFNLIMLCSTVSFVIFYSKYKLTKKN